MERLDVKTDGFYGIYQQANEPVSEKLATIVIGGTEGNENVPLNVGKMFAERGISALGVCYWNVNGLPDNLVNVPIDPFEKAIKWLQAKGYEKIAIYGISKGGELALLVASIFPEIMAVVAISPIQCVWSGMKGNKKMSEKSFADISEFSYKGIPFPFMKAKVTYAKAIRNLILERQINLRYIYEKSLKNFQEETAIKVEKINGDILFIYAENDMMWPSKEAVQYMTKRLKEKSFSHKVKVLSYEKASHILVPLSPKQLKIFKIERKFPIECVESRNDAFNQTIKWLLSR